MPFDVIAGVELSFDAFVELDPENIFTLLWPVLNDVLVHEG